MRKTKSKTNYTYAVGRRKSASARVRLFRGKGASTVNAKLAEKYFSSPQEIDAWSKPFRVVEATDKFYVTIKVVGGGKRGQLEASVLGIARTLSKLNEKNRKLLKKAGLLTRDSRVRERRKVAMGGKARRKRQSPKR
jgi:small subunit ribosomal protein S9